MRLRRAPVVSVLLALGALTGLAGLALGVVAGAEAGLSTVAGPPTLTGVSTVARDGRTYVDAVAIAARLDARLEGTPERIYLRNRGHVVIFTRGWARVEVDGRPVVLESPVRVEQARWLVPEAFVRQVMPMLEARTPVPAPAVKPADPPRVAVTSVESPKAAPTSRVTEPPASTAPAVRVTGPPPSTAPAVRVIEVAPLVQVPEPAKPTAPVVRVIEVPKPTGPLVQVPEPWKSTAPAGATAALRETPATRHAPAGATLEDLRLRSYPTFTRVVVETSALVRHRVEVVTPKELRIRLTALSASRRAEEIRDGLVEDVQVEPADGDTLLRVTFTNGSLQPKTSTLSDPPRLLFDFARPPEPGPRASATAPAPLRTLVLDAGHGGHDSGAVGPGGLMEKDLVLDVTRRVANLVEAGMPGIKVLLSRKGDVFVPLRDRTSFANRERADLFVSIHANAHREAASEGVETYFLSSEATDNAARQVAAVENSVVQLEKPAGRGSRAEAVKAILWDLAQSEFQQESSRLAEVVQDSMTQSLRIPNRGVKQAGFYVLGGAAMPAILVEIGFVTNPREERKLKESKYRDDIARAIFAGIAEYQQELDRRASRAAAR